MSTRWLLRSVSAFGKPVVIEASILAADRTGYPASFQVSGVTDLSGDGVMEVVLDGRAWEGEWVTVYEMTDTGSEPRISAGCGV